MKFSSNKFCLQVLIILSTLGFQSASASQVLIFPGSKLVNETVTEAGQLDVVLSAPKRISNTLEIEKQSSVSGLVESKLYELKSSAQLDSVYNHYLEGLSSGGNILFQCEKRACGSSNYWANKIFDEHKLYGRDSSQYYIAALERKAEKEVWRAVYIVQNGLRKKYVYELSVSSSKNNQFPEKSELGVWVNGTAAAQTGYSASNIASLKRYIQQEDVKELFLVAYADNELSPTDSLWDQLQTKSDAQAGIIREQLGGSALPLKVKLLGPLHSEGAFEKQPVWFRLFVY